MSSRPGRSDQPNVDRPRRLWLRSVRFRTALAAIAVVGVALGIGAAGMLVLLQRSLMGSLAASTKIQATSVASLAHQGLMQGTLPGRSSLVQVLSSSGAVVASTPDEQGQPAMVAPLAARAPTSVTVEPRLGLITVSLAEGPWLVVRESVRAPGGRWLTVAVATSLDTLHEVLARLALVLGVGLPALAIGVGVLVWFLAGRALRPVEAIRSEVAALSERDMHRRVPEPAVHDEIGRLARTMNTMLDRLEAASVRQRGFVGDASHELRTPLAAMQVQLEVALAHPEGDWRPVAEEVLDEARHMARIVEDLLNLARADGPNPRRVVVDLDEIVLEEVARRRGGDGPVWDVGQVSAGRVMGDRDQLRSVVRNLADNGSRFARTRVSVELRRRGEWVEMVVADDGPGIAEADRERVFERFTRADESRTRDGGGAGLGLAIVREIVVRHGGTVRATAASGGARLVVRLPALAD